MVIDDTRLKQNICKTTGGHYRDEYQAWGPHLGDVYVCRCGYIEKVSPLIKNLKKGDMVKYYRYAYGSKTRRKNGIFKAEVVSIEEKRIVIDYYDNDRRVRASVLPSRIISFY